MDKNETVERHYTVEEVAALLGTTVRFPRRLIAERRIRSEFLAEGTVEPTPRRRHRTVAR